MVNCRFPATVTVGCSSFYLGGWSWLESQIWLRDATSAGWAKLMAIRRQSGVSDVPGIEFANRREAARDREAPRRCSARAPFVPSGSR